MIRKANEAALGKRFYNFRDSELVRYIQHFPVYPVGRVNDGWLLHQPTLFNECDTYIGTLHVFDGYALSNEDREHKRRTTAICSGIAGYRVPFCAPCQE